MIDSGANGNYASTQLAERIGKQQKPQPYPLNMADGTPMDYEGGWVRHEIRETRLDISNHTELITLDVAPIKYDIILGMKWLQEHSPQIDWKQRILRFSECNHRKRGKKRDPTLDEGRTDLTPQTRAIWVRPCRRMLAEIAKTIPEEYKDYADLFTEKAEDAQLPEHKPWDHEIQLEEGATLNHKG